MKSGTAVKDCSPWVTHSKAGMPTRNHDLWGEPSPSRDTPEELQPNGNPCQGGKRPEAPQPVGHLDQREQRHKRTGRQKIIKCRVAERNHYAQNGQTPSHAKKPKQNKTLLCRSPHLPTPLNTSLKEFW